MAANRKAQFAPHARLVCVGDDFHIDTHRTHYVRREGLSKFPVPHWGPLVVIAAKLSGAKLGI